MKPDADECGRWMISIKEILTKRRKTTIVRAQMPPRRIWRPLLAVFCTSELYLSNKAYNKDILNAKRTDELKINEYP